MKYHIPRNVKKGMDFLGLDWKGWLLFLPTVIVFGGATILIIPIFKLKVILLLLILGISYVMFQVNENSGAMNYHFVTEFINWLKSEKNADIYWEEHDKYTSLKMKVNGFDKTTLKAYRKYKENEGRTLDVGIKDEAEN